MNKDNKCCSQIVSLITDFGTVDSYVGQMKGTLLSNNSSLTIIDITHNIRPQDVEQAAYELYESYQHFPDGTVHLVVVDPGVGTNRAILAAQAMGHFFVAPDNGVLSLFFEAGNVERVVKVQVENRSNISNTFHGRDIMAPVAAALAKGAEFEAIGDIVSSKDCVNSLFQRVVPTEKGIEGKVLRIDHFGNVRTSIRKSDLQGRCLDSLEIIVSGYRIKKGIVATYGDNPDGEICCLFDSSGFLEVAITDGSAAAAIEATVYDDVSLFW
jgi:S-adenosylmethionine hydrolase